MDNIPPIVSGNPIIDTLFGICVYILLWLASLFGITYNTINILIFCVIWPMFTVALIVIVIKQRLKIKKLESKLKQIGKNDV
ncbi:MAG: hypothetical protein QXH80_01515 [Candidatus Nanoarchaeia archaeon]